MIRREPIAPRTKPEPAMDAASPRWREITVSEYPWERDALAFVRGRLPDIEPYQVWTNFEFIADDGSINEVDLLALTPKGFFLVEIKSAPGVVEGDRGAWTWRREKRVRTVDNPLLLANRKAKKLIALLRGQPAMRTVRSPFLEARVFLSHESVDCRLPAELRDRVHLRDTGAGRAERPGIVAALMRGTPPAGQRCDRPLARALRRAMEEAGVRRSQRSRQVGDYRLDELLLEGPGYQDWTARHVAVESERARVRIYGAPLGVSDEERAALARAAEREYRILQDVRHEGILAAKAFTGHPLGPALVFAHRDGAERFDHWLAARAERLDVDVRIHLLRQIAEALRHAHAKRLVHRALSPQSLLVLDPDAALPRVQVFNWQTGARGAGTAGAVTSGATRLGTLVEDAAWIYLAPEAVTGHGAPAEQSDVFSLGALACHLFSGRAPASSPIEMNERLRREQGLRISSVLDGAGEPLQRLVQDATHPDVSLRLASVADFLTGLEAVEDELTAPEVRSRPDPLEARPGDELEHGLTVKRRLGRGSTALALLVERGGREQVLKVALSSKDNGRLEAEAEVLRRLRHQSVVELHDVLRFGGRVGLLMARAGRETLADRLREEGSLHLELLERFGEDLLAAVDWLEQQGVPHRDVKPENLGVAKVGSRLHLVLFDFSLARTPAENVRAGTRPYLDPFLAARRPPRWDTHAERFAAAVTLHEMAAGSLPRWGDGRSEPAVLDCEATVDADAFEPAVREGLTAFFGRALRREFGERFDNAQEMLRAWRQVFPAASRPETVPDPPPAAVPDPDAGPGDVSSVVTNLPGHDCDDFRADFEPRRGPGFFPGAGGYFHGCAPAGDRRIVFFGTDFGTEKYWEEVKDGDGERATQPTLRELRKLIDEACVDPCSCHLTNAVLALARTDSNVGNERIYKQHPKYLRKCADFHREWISSHAPGLVVLMGGANARTYLRGVFRHVFQPIFPTLEERWRAPLTSIYENGRELVRQPEGPDVLCMFHPSYRNLNPRFPKCAVDEERKRREEVWRRIVEHLSRYG